MERSARWISRISYVEPIEAGRLFGAKPLSEAVLRSIVNRTLGINFSDILIEIQTLFCKMAAILVT